jgi:two-component system response regulator (stage 0 sporulation protein F)
MSGGKMGYKILVIDDAPIIRDFLRDVLCDAGYQVDTAENGAQGLELIEKNEYILIFCDVHMPVMNGIIAVGKIKEMKPEIPIIMTDSLPDQEAENILKAGAVCCLGKPFDLMELKSTMALILNNKVGLKA